MLSLILKNTMYSPVRIAAVVINYKTPSLTMAAVRSLCREMDADTDAIFVVDNCSNDGSFEILRESITAEPWLGRIELVASEKNGGFSYGNNLAMNCVLAEAYLLLNSDAELDAGALGLMWFALNNDLNMGIVGPSIHGVDGELQFSCFFDKSPWNELLMTANTSIVSNLLGYFGVSEVGSLPQGGTEREVDWLSFVCVLIRGATYLSVGPLDDGYFMYREDNDYCRRTRNKGWGVRYLPQAGAIHLNKGLSGRYLDRQPIYFYESRTRYFVKYYGRAGWFMANLAWTAGRMISILREFLQGKPRSVAVGAWRDIWTWSCGQQPLDYPRPLAEQRWKV